MKRLSALTVGVVVVMLSAGAALAAWTVGSIGASGRGAARTLPAGAAPTATASGSTVTVSFGQVAVGDSLLGALTGGRYTVRRYNSAGAAQTMSGTCSTRVTGSAGTLSCVETDVATGTWLYRVTPILSDWTGAESGSSPSVTIATDTLGDGTVTR